MNSQWLKHGKAPFAVAFRARARRQAPPPNVSVEYYPRDRWSVIEIAGEMDLQVVSLMPDLSDREAAQVVFDLHRVTFMDGAGLGVIAIRRRRAMSLGGEVRIVGPSQQVRRLLALTGFDRVVPVFDSLPAATSGDAQVPLEHGW